MKKGGGESQGSKASRVKGGGAQGSKADRVKGMNGARPPGFLRS